MSFQSFPDRYGTVATAIHWIGAVLIVSLIVVGFAAAAADDLGTKASLLRLHVPLGAAVLVLTLARIAWWLFWDNKPREAVGMSRWQSMAARSVHKLLYVAILGLGLSGVAMMALSGAGPVLFGDAPGSLPDFWDYPPRYGHAAMARLMVLLLAFLIGAALYHQFVRRDRLLGRMGIGRTPSIATGHVTASGQVAPSPNGDPT